MASILRITIARTTSLTRIGAGNSLRRARYYATQGSDGRSGFPSNTARNGTNSYTTSNKPYSAPPKTDPPHASSSQAHAQHTNSPPLKHASASNTTPLSNAKRSSSSDFELFKPKISVVGVGGAGGNAVNHMITGQLEGVEFLVCNTDAQALSQSLSFKRVQLGGKLTKGLGAGAKPDVGMHAAEESITEIVDQLKDSNLVFFAAGMGGGTGTGATPVIARELKRLQPDILTIAVVTKPFTFEGNYRRRLAEQGLQQLAEHVDTMLVISNQKLLSVSNEHTKFSDAFMFADEILHAGVRTITDLMVIPGTINLDFSDVEAILRNMKGTAMMGVGEAEGDGRALRAARDAIYNPLLDNETTIQGARGVLINITGGHDLTLHEIDAAASMVQKEADPEANIIFGQCLNPNMEGRIRVSVVCAK